MAYMIIAIARNIYKVIYAYAVKFIFIYVTGPGKTGLIYMLNLT